MEYGGDTLSRYDVSFAPCETKLVSVTNPRLFPTKHRAPPLKLFALDEVLGEGGWLKAFGLEAYAPRSGGGPRRCSELCAPTSKPFRSTSSRPLGAVVEVNHAAAETTFVQQFELQADVVGQGSLAASHHHRYDE